jgi:hypothetical protein
MVFIYNSLPFGKEIARAPRQWLLLVDFDLLPLTNRMTVTPFPLMSDETVMSSSEKSLVDK